jgi:hypothetical protein
MRNEDGSTPGQPRRTSVEIYLRDEAREVLRNERLLAKESCLPALHDSKLIEELLIWHANHADREDRTGLPVDELRHSFSTMKLQLAIARDQLSHQSDRPTKHNIRTLRQVLVADRSAPTPVEYANECVRRNNTVNNMFIDKLIGELRPLFLYSMKDSDLRSKIRRTFEAHINRIFRSMT